MDIIDIEPHLAPLADHVGRFEVLLLAGVLGLLLGMVVLAAVAWTALNLLAAVWATDEC